jgi:hypothetical protein
MNPFEEPDRDLPNGCWICPKHNTLIVTPVVRAQFGMLDTCPKCDKEYLRALRTT